MKYQFTFIVDLCDDENPTEMLDYFEQSIQLNLEDITAIKEASVNPVDNI
jgi:hypothetical protein